MKEQHKSAEEEYKESIDEDIRNQRIIDIISCVGMSLTALIWFGSIIALITSCVYR